MQNVDTGLVEPVDQGLGYHLPGRAHGGNGPLADGDQLVTVAGCHRQIVDHQQHGFALGGDAMDRLHHLGLVTYIEGTGGLVEQHHVAVLRQDHRQPRPLCLPAGEGRCALLPDAFKLHPLAGNTHHAGILLPPLIEPALMRVTAILHQLLHQNAGRQGRPLGQIGELPRQPFHGVAGKRLAFEQDFAALGFHLAG